MSLYKKSINKNSENKPTRYYSSKQENSVAKAVSGKPTANSGATMWSKGDVVSENILIECKTKTKDSDSISIKKEWFEKNKKEMIFMGKDYSILAFNFGPDQPNYYILDEFTFQEFVDYLNSREK